MDDKRTAEEMVKPPFPEKMSFKEMLEGLFNLDFMTKEEQQTIFDAGEMYANGCIKQYRQKVREETESEKMAWRPSPTSQNKR